MKKAKLVISDKVAEELDATYRLDYPYNAVLGEEDILELFKQLYRRGFNEGVWRIEEAIRQVKKEKVI